MLQSLLKNAKIWTTLLTMQRKLTKNNTIFQRWFRKSNNLKFGFNFINLSYIEIFFFKIFLKDFPFGIFFQCQSIELNIFWNFQVLSSVELGLVCLRYLRMYFHYSVSWVESKLHAEHLRKNQRNILQILEWCFVIWYSQYIRRGSRNKKTRSAHEEMLVIESFIEIVLIIYSSFGCADLYIHVYVTKIFEVHTHSHWLWGGN